MSATEKVKVLNVLSKLTKDSASPNFRATMYSPSPLAQYSNRARNSRFLKQGDLTFLQETTNKDNNLDDNGFAVEGWTNRTKHLDIYTSNLSPRLDRTPSEGSILEGTSYQNIFKNELANLSNGLQPVQAKENARGTTQKYMRATIKPGMRIGSTISARMSPIAPKEIRPFGQEKTRDESETKERSIETSYRIKHLKSPHSIKPGKPIPKEKAEKKNDEVQVKEPPRTIFIKPAKLIGFVPPVVQKKDLPNMRLYLKVIQMLDKVKGSDDKSLSNRENNTNETASSTTGYLPSVESFAKKQQSSIKNSNHLTGVYSQLEVNNLSRGTPTISEAKDITNDSMKMRSEKRDSSPYTLTLLPIADASISINSRRLNKPWKDRKNIHPNNVNSSLVAKMPFENIDEKGSYLSILETECLGSNHTPTSEMNLPESSRLATQSSSKAKGGRFIPYCQQEMKYEHLDSPEKNDEEAASFIDRIEAKWGVSTKGKGWTGREIESGQKGSLRTKVYKFPLPVIDNDDERTKNLTRGKNKDFNATLESFSKKEALIAREKEVKFQKKHRGEHLKGVRLIRKLPQNILKGFRSQLAGGRFDSIETSPDRRRSFGLLRGFSCESQERSPLANGEKEASIHPNEDGF